MLVLSRKKNESVIVTVPPSAEPQTIEMVIVEIRGDKVRTGWSASRSIDIHRGEVQAAIEREGARTLAAGAVSEGAAEPHLQE